jgi:hypothetical protein
VPQKIIAEDITTIRRLSRMAEELKTKNINPRNTKHGACQFNHRLYSIWTTMIHRCEDPKREKYKDYGARGILVCDEWHNPMAFEIWAMANSYSLDLQIDRTNNELGYSPDNCRWVTPKQNSRNRRNTKFMTLSGQTKSVAEWCETIPISAFTIYWWYKKFGRMYAETRIMEGLKNAR